MQKILIVDNNKTALNGLSEILTEEGYTVNVATNATVALFSDFSKCNVLITDQNLMDLTGLELADKITAINPNVKVVIMASFQVQGWQNNPDYLWLTKPLKVDLLLALLKDQFKHHSRTI